jgi:hypothetical protein
MKREAKPNKAIGGIIYNIKDVAVFCPGCGCPLRIHDIDISLKIPYLQCPRPSCQFSSTRFKIPAEPIELEILDEEGGED